MCTKLVAIDDHGEQEMADNPAFLLNWNLAATRTRSTSGQPRIANLNNFCDQITFLSACLNGVSASGTNPLTSLRVTMRSGSHSITDRASYIRGKV